MDRRRGRPKQQRRAPPGVTNMPIIKPLPSGAVAAIPAAAGGSSSSSSSTSTTSSSTATSAVSSPSASHYTHSPPATSYAIPSGYHGMDHGITATMGSPPVPMRADGNSNGNGGGGGSANASDLLLSFLTQTVREMKEKITSLEDDNHQLRTKHRKLKRRLKDNDDRVEQLFGTVANLAQQSFGRSSWSAPTPTATRPNAYASSSMDSPMPSGSTTPSSLFYGSSSSSSSYPLPVTTSAALRQQQMPLQDFLDRSSLSQNSPAAAATSASYGGGGQSLSSSSHHQPLSSVSPSSIVTSSARAAHQQQMQYQRQQQRQQLLQQQQQSTQAYTTTGAASSGNNIADYAAPPAFFQQHQQQQLPQQEKAMPMQMPVAMMDPCLAPGLGLPSYTINSIGDIKRHFPYLEECYFEKATFVVNDLRKPYLVMQFVSMESTVVTASNAYCSLSGFTLLLDTSRLTRRIETEILSPLMIMHHTQHEVCHTKKLVALLPRSYKKRMIPLFVHNNEPNTTTTLETSGRLVRKDGQIVSLDYQMQFFFDAQGKVKWLFASIEKMVGVDKATMYNNYHEPGLGDEERIKLLRDRLRDEEKQEWDELIHEYLRSAASVPVLTLTAYSDADIDSSSSSSSSSSSITGAALTQQDLPTSPSSSSSSSSSARGLSTTSSLSSSGHNSPPASPLAASPLSPMTTSWLAEMLATPPNAAAPSPGALQHNLHHRHHQPSAASTPNLGGSIGYDDC